MYSFIQKLFSLFFLVSVTLFASNHTDSAMIPKPQSIHFTQGTFVLHKQTVYQSNTALASKALSYLKKHLKQHGCSLIPQTQKRERSSISFKYNPKKIKKEEGYALTITPQNIHIEARNQAGFFYAVISLMQLMEPLIWSSSREKQYTWRIPACSLFDYPQYAWRGLMLDCSRNFFSKTYVKKFIDRMAQYKLNRFHWHLTDDEGWRIEIKAYPLLTQIGAKRGPHTKLPFSTFPAMRGAKNRVQSGYYSQKEIQEIVAYAKARCIEILPEIDIPAHAKAAIVSYPHLLQEKADKSQYRSVQRIHNNTLNPALPNTYIFLDHVLSEVSQLFPFDYIHLGGDEVPKGAWKDSPAVKNYMKTKHLKNKRAVENDFFYRMDTLLARYGKKMVVWQEVASAQAKLRKSTLFMAWKSKKSGVNALKAHRNTIMAPVEYLYFDQQYIRSKKEYGHTWSTPISTQKTYSFNPSHSRYLKGVEACLWSETLLNEKIADYLTWPRALALSEVAWTAQKKRHWKSFRQRVLKRGLPSLKIQKIHYRPFQKRK